MKILMFASVLFLASVSQAQPACEELNTQIRVARDAIKALVEIRGPANSYLGGAGDETKTEAKLTIQPQFTYFKDWYKVTVRKADCRVLNIELVAESLPL